MLPETTEATETTPAETESVVDSVPPVQESAPSPSQESKPPKKGFSLTGFLSNLLPKKKSPSPKSESTPKTPFSASDFDFEETPELVEHRQKYPFILTTARQLEHYNAGTMTRRTDNQELSPMDYLEVNPLDAADKNISAGDSVKIFSDRGSVNIPVKLTYLVKPGVVRTTFHQPEVFINMITGNVGDEFTLTPEYKVVAVDFEKV